MTDTMIERVAASIYETWARLKDFEVKTWPELMTLVAKPGYMVAKDFHAMALAEARAAIEAMREPTPNMLEDMRHVIGTIMHITLPDYALIAAWKMAVLTALSDAALQETKG